MHKQKFLLIIVALLPMLVSCSGKKNDPYTQISILELRFHSVRDEIEISSIGKTLSVTHSIEFIRYFANKLTDKFRIVYHVGSKNVSATEQSFIDELKQISKHLNVELEIVYPTGSLSEFELTLFQSFDQFVEEKNKGL